MSRQEPQAADIGGFFCGPPRSPHPAAGVRWLVVCASIEWTKAEGGPPHHSFSLTFILSRWERGRTGFLLAPRDTASQLWCGLRVGTLVLRCGDSQVRVVPPEAGDGTNEGRRNLGPPGPTPHPDLLPQGEKGAAYDHAYFRNQVPGGPLTGGRGRMWRFTARDRAIEASPSPWPLPLGEGTVGRLLEIAFRARGASRSGVAR
jgi:hypothetical protein